MFNLKSRQEAGANSACHPSPPALRLLSPQALQPLARRLQASWFLDRLHYFDTFIILL